MSTVSEFSYHLIDKVIHLALTFRVSIPIIERAFSTTKIVTTSYPNKMGDGFLRNYLIIYI